MKFLCIACNTQMKLIREETPIAPDEGGSLSVKWECPECLFEMGMLTNPFETQLVSSIGVELGGKAVPGQPPREASAQAVPSASTGKCPFPHALRQDVMESARAGGMTSQGKSSTHGLNEAEAMKQAMLFGGGEAQGNGQGEVGWSAQAMVRLHNIPEFIRPVAKKGIEKFARERGQSLVDEAVLDAAKEHFNM